MSPLTLDTCAVSSVHSQLSETPFTRKLLTSGYMTSEEIQELQRDSCESSQSLLEILRAVRGQPLPTELWEFYQQQKRFELKVFYGIEVFNPSLNELTVPELAEIFEQLQLSPEICRRHQFIPFKIELEGEGQTVFIAQVNPDQLEEIDELFNGIFSGRPWSIRQWVIMPEDYEKILTEYEADQQQS